MGYFSTTPAPPLTYEIIPQVVTLLKAGSTLTTALGGSSNIYGFSHPVDRSGSGWKHVVVREPVRPPINEAINKYRSYRFEVMVEVHETVVNPHQFIQAAHKEIFDLLVNQSLSPTKCAVVLPVERRTMPTAPMYDPSDHALFSTAQFIITIKPLE